MHKNILIFFVIIIALGFIPKGEKVRLIKKSAIRATIQDVSLDRYNNIYYSDDKQVIHKIDTNLKNELFYSSKTPNHIDLLEAWNGLNIFAFHKDAQEVKILDRFLTLKTEFSLESENIGFADLAAPSYDNNIWIWDNIDFSLKKIDINNRSLLIDNRLDLIISDQDYHPVFLKEYQNKVYLQDSTSGVLVFDNMGNYKTKLPVHSEKPVSFTDNFLVYQTKDSLTKYHLYNYSIETSKIPEGQSFLMDKKRIATFNNDSIFIYQLID